jgi:hypothetical protein
VRDRVPSESERIATLGLREIAGWIVALAVTLSATVPSAGTDEPS